MLRCHYRLEYTRKNPRNRNCTAPICADSTNWGSAVESEGYFSFCIQSGDAAFQLFIVVLHIVRPCAGAFCHGLDGAVGLIPCAGDLTEGLTDKGKAGIQSAVIEGIGQMAVDEILQ